VTSVTAHHRAGLSPSVGVDNNRGIFTFDPYCRTHGCRQLCRPALLSPICSPLSLSGANRVSLVRSIQDGNSPAALPSANGHPASSNGDGGNWLSDGRWKALRRLGSTSGWLIDPTEVSLGKVRRS